MSWSLVMACGGIIIGTTSIGIGYGTIAAVTQSQGFRQQFNWDHSCRTTYEESQDFGGVVGKWERGICVDCVCDTNETLMARHLGLLHGLHFVGMSLVVVIGPIVELVGRKKSYLVAAICSAGATLICAVTPSFTSFVVARIVQGCANGAIMGTGSTYLSEISPPRWRVTITTANFLGIAVGQLLSAIIALCTIRVVPNLQILFTVPALFLLLSFAVVGSVPESPRWEFVHRGEAVARKALRLYRLRDIEEEMTEIRNSTGQDLGLVAIWANRWKMMMGSTFLIGQQMSGIASVISYGPRYYSAFADRVTTFYIYLLVTGVRFAAQLSSVFLVTIVPRRLLLIGTAVGMAMGNFLQAVFTLNYAFDDETEKFTSPVYGWCYVTAQALFMMAYSLAWVGLPWCILSEFLPTEVRSVGALYGCCLIGILSGSNLVILPWLEIAVGLRWIYMKNFLWCVLLAIFCCYTVKENGNQTLEQIQHNSKVSKENKSAIRLDCG